MNTKLLIGLLILGTASLFLMNNQMNLQQTQQPNGELLFKNWQQTYNKFYENQAIAEFRMAVFLNNLQVIEQQNQQNDGVVYGVNQFSDLTQDEFVSTYLGFISQNQEAVEQDIHYGDIPNDVDWRSKGAVTGIKDQGKCGSCWAFSSTGNLEGLNFIKNNKLVPLSEQQLMDCSYRYGNMGCNGGLMNNAFEYVQEHGICAEADYPYKAKVGKCVACTVQFKTKSYTRVPRTNEGLQAAIALQPISVAVDASNWQNYKSGVFKNCDVNLNHGVLAVGYTADTWIVKNSWGEKWGEQGYIRLALGDTCGVLDEASYASF